MMRIKKEKILFMLKTWCIRKCSNLQAQSTFLLFISVEKKSLKLHKFLSLAGKLLILSLCFVFPLLMTVPFIVQRERESAERKRNEKINLTFA